MEFIGYISRLLYFFKDRRIINNIEEMIQKMIEKKTLRLFTIAKDKKEYNRYKSLLDGSLKSILDNEKISQALRENSVEAMSGQKQITLIHDPCDIRKKYSKELENLGKVLDLDKNTINGYYTFNTIAVDNENKRLHLVDTKVYSNREPQFVSQKELELYFNGTLQKSGVPEQRVQIIRELLKTNDYINISSVTKEQLQKTSFAFKQERPEVQITHILDSGFDNQDVFVYIDKELQDEFVIRLKLSRNSNETYLDDDSKERYIKIKEAKLAHKKRFPIQRIQIKDKVYFKASCLIEYDDITFDKQTYTIVRVTLKDKKGQKIFKEPMLLLTNRQVQTAEQAYGVYLTYLQRSKIEGVFKFLKDILGWEESQIRDFESIKNIIALCFFIGGYFYEIESELIKNVTFQSLCDLGDGKGKYTRHYFLQGLAKILTYNMVEKFVEEQGLNSQQFENMKNVLRY